MRPASREFESRGMGVDVCALVVVTDNWKPRATLKKNPECDSRPPLWGQGESINMSVGDNFYQLWKAGFNILMNYETNFMWPRPVEVPVCSPCLSFLTFVASYGDDVTRGKCLHSGKHSPRGGTMTLLLLITNKRVKLKVPHCVQLPSSPSVVIVTVSFSSRMYFPPFNFYSFPFSNSLFFFCQLFVYYPECIFRASFLLIDGFVVLHYLSVDDWLVLGPDGI